MDHISVDLHLETRVSQVAQSELPELPEQQEDEPLPTNSNVDNTISKCITRLTEESTKSVNRKCDPETSNNGNKTNCGSRVEATMSETPGHNTNNNCDTTSDRISSANNGNINDCETSRRSYSVCTTSSRTEMCIFVKDLQIPEQTTRSILDISSTYLPSVTNHNCSSHW